MTGYGGGLCLTQQTQEKIKGNSLCQASQADGKCDEQCNYAFWDYDGGDCCLRDDEGESAYRVCLEPQNPLRRWLTTDQIRSLNPSPSPNSFNLYLANCTESTLCGGSTIMPWLFSPRNSASQGSIFLADTFNPRASPDSGGGFVPVHEFGHTFGLLHTFNGLEMLFLTSSIPFSYACAHRAQFPCADVVQYPIGQLGSLLTGDLIDDTRVSLPTVDCVDPQGEDCAGSPWHETAIDNVMGFNLNCPNLQFTKHQRARMHCYINQIYLHWILNNPTPYPPAAGFPWANQDPDKQSPKPSDSDVPLLIVYTAACLIALAIFIWFFLRLRNLRGPNISLEETLLVEDSKGQING